MAEMVWTKAEQNNDYRLVTFPRWPPLDCIANPYRHGAATAFGERDAAYRPGLTTLWSPYVKNGRLMLAGRFIAASGVLIVPNSKPARRGVIMGTGGGSAANRTLCGDIASYFGLGCHGRARRPPQFEASRLVPSAVSA